MKQSLLFLFVMMIIACKSLSDHQEILGHYRYYGKNIHYDLTLNNDSTFFMSIGIQDAAPKGYSKWYYIKGDTIYLKVNKPKELIEMIGQGNLVNFEEKMQVLNGQKLKYNNVMLRKVK